jgi:hypothetical protein
MIKRQNINKYFLLLSAFCVNTVYALPEDDYWITPEGTSGAKSITIERNGRRPVLDYGKLRHYQ